jgi:hypothetical protein
MKKSFLVAALILLSASGAFAASAKSYKVTGPVTALTDSTITVQKGTEKWEIARTSDTKLPDSVKVGSKVKVYYSMSASKVEDVTTAPAAKPTTPAAPTKKAK